MLQLQRQGGSAHPLRRSLYRYPPSSGFASALALSWERPLAPRPAFRVVLVLGSAPSRNSTSAWGKSTSVPYGALLRTMALRQPLRVLCLAGFRQSERGFREKTGALRKALRGRAELVCLSGPHPVVDAAGPEGAGPESGETSSAPEMRSEVVSVLPVPHNILQLVPTLYPPSLLPPSLFILPVSFIFSILTFQASTLICLPPLPMPVYSPPHFPQTSPVSRLSLCHSQTFFFSSLSSWIRPCPNLVLSPLPL